MAQSAGTAEVRVSFGAVVDAFEALVAALREIVRRDACSEYGSIYTAPAEFARIARDALKDAGL